ncbi:hypothetical protein SXANM310S_01961 [Streptomyces xanthochromogenes]
MRWRGVQGACGTFPLSQEPALDLYEYEARELFRDHGIAVPDAAVAASPREARAAAESLGGRVVVKAR